MASNPLRLHYTDGARFVGCLYSIHNITAATYLAINNVSTTSTALERFTRVLPTLVTTQLRDSRGTKWGSTWTFQFDSCVIDRIVFQVIAATSLATDYTRGKIGAVDAYLWLSV